ncbi:GCSH-like protein, partial [Mya arenaria]
MISGAVSANGREALFTRRRLVNVQGFRVIAQNLTKQTARASVYRKFHVSTIAQQKYFSEKHEWVSLEGDANIGEAGALESVKAASDLYSPISGTVTEINETARDEPKIVNESPHEDGWLFKMTVGDAKDLEELMDEGTYTEFLKTPVIKIHYPQEYDACGLLLGASTVTLVFLVQMTFTFRPNISNMATGQWSLSPRHYLCADTRGRLGNQMFQYASVFGVSRRTNMSMRIKRSDLVAKYFHVSAADSWKYFEHVEEELKMEFRFKKTIAVFAERVFEEAVKGTKYYGKGGAFVGIHIRRGDMATFA